MMKYHYRMGDNPFLWSCDEETLELFYITNCRIDEEELQRSIYRMVFGPMSSGYGVEFEW